MPQRQTWRPAHKRMGIRRAAAEALFIVKECAVQMHAGTLDEVPSITVRLPTDPSRLLIMPVRADIFIPQSCCEPNLSFTRLDL
jgi:hypothetical protein